MDPTLLTGVRVKFLYPPHMTIQRHKNELKPHLKYWKILRKKAQFVAGMECSEVTLRDPIIGVVDQSSKQLIGR
jgi:hypothetical protein